MTLQKAFRFRAFVSVLTGFSFVMIAATGAVLFAAPPGRVANRDGWTVWQLDKHQWSALHLCFGAVFVLCSVVHIWLNRRALVHYFIRTAATAGPVRLEWIAALLLCGVVFWGTLKPAAPFRSLLQLQDRLKHRWDRPRQQGSAPAGQQQQQTDAATGEHGGGGGGGRSSLAQVCDAMGGSVQDTLEALRAAGIEATPDQTLRQIADENGLHPSDIRRYVK